MERNTQLRGEIYGCEIMSFCVDSRRLIKFMERESVFIGYAKDDSIQDIITGLYAGE